MPESTETLAAEARATTPPGPADAAALEHGRELVATGRDRAAAFWAETERAARIVGVRK